MGLPSLGLGEYPEQVIRYLPEVNYRTQLTPRAGQGGRDVHARVAGAVGERTTTRRWANRYSSSRETAE